MGLNGLKMCVRVCVCVGVCVCVFGLIACVLMDTIACPTGPHVRINQAVSWTPGTV